MGNDGFDSIGVAAARAARKVSASSETSSSPFDSATMRSSTFAMSILELGPALRAILSSAMFACNCSRRFAFGDARTFSEPLCLIESMLAQLHIGRDQPIG